jgi:hypothetical protein
VALIEEVEVGASERTKTSVTLNSISEEEEDVWAQRRKRIKAASAGARGCLLASERRGYVGRAVNM